MTSNSPILFSVNFKWLIKSLKNLYKISSKNEYNIRLNGIYLEVTNDGKCISLKASNGTVFIENRSKVEIIYCYTEDKNFSFFLSNEQVLSFIAIHGKRREKNANFTYKKITEGINEKIFLSYVTEDSLIGCEYPLSEWEDYPFECCEDDIINYPKILVQSNFKTMKSFDIDFDKVKNYIKDKKFILGLPIEELYCSGDMPKNNFLKFSRIKEKEENVTLINEMFFKGQERIIKKRTNYIQFYEVSGNELRRVFSLFNNNKAEKNIRARLELLVNKRITGEYDERECLTFEVWNKKYSDLRNIALYLKPKYIESI